MKKALFALCTLMAFAGCGPKLTLWRVSFLPGNATCNPTPATAPKTVTTSDTQVDSGVWEIWEGPNNKVYLQGPTIGRATSGGNVIEGTFANKAYTFNTTSKTTQKSPNAENPTATIDTTSDNKITLNIASDTMTGTWTSSSTNNCVGSGCPSNFHEQAPDCTSTATVNGRLVEAANEHQL